MTVDTKMTEEERKSEKTLLKELETDFNYKLNFVWPNVIAYIILHATALYGIYSLAVFGLWKTFAWRAQGITMGAHRLYSHKAFKAHPSIKILANFLQIIAGQNSMHTWVRDHRLHHKYTDTDADPHNAVRGFFYSHIGWLLMKKHPAVIEQGRKIDLSDINADPYVTFQKKYFLPLFALISVAIPVAVPMYFWNESFRTAFCFCFVTRYVLSLNFTWLINSAAHMFGTKPYDKNILPVDTFLITLLTYGEGWHNYHHVFPSDYRTSELGAPYNITSKIIETFAYLGLAYDLRTIPDNLVKHRMEKTGDGYVHKY